MSAQETQANDMPTEESAEQNQKRICDFESIQPVIAVVNSFQDASKEETTPPFFFVAQDSDTSMKIICCGDLDDYANLLSNAALENDIFFSAIREAVQNVIRLKFADQMKKRLHDIGALDADGNPTPDAGERLMADLKKMAEENGFKIDAEGQVEEKPAA